MSEHLPFPEMSQSEAQALLAAIKNSYGPCQCQQHAAVAGHIVWIDTCAGHAFLNEEHRLARLLWIHRTAQMWQSAEHMQKLSDKLQRALDEALREAS